MSNATLFKEYLDKKGIVPETRNSETSVSFEFQQKLKTGASGRLLVVLEEDTLASIYALDYISLSNTARKEYMCKVLNELNIKYTYFKFYLSTENIVVLQCSLPIRNNTFSADLIFNLLGNVLGTMEDEYSGIMKAMLS